MKLALVNLILGTFIASADEVPSIIVREHTEVKSERALSLGDIIDANLSPAAKERLAQVSLGPSLKVGERAEFSGEALTRLFRAQLKNDVRGAVLRIPDKVVVENIGTRPTVSEIEAQLRAKWEPYCLCQLRFEGTTLPTIPRWSEGATWSLSLRPEAPRGAFTVALQVLPDGAASQPETLWLRGRASWWKRAPIAKQTLILGQRVQDSDVEFQDRDVTFSSDGVPTPEETLGRILRQSINAGQIIYSAMLQREKAVRRGDVVKISLGDEKWEVSTTAVVEQDGELGDMVRVKNPRTQQALTATVVGRREVRIE